jgi:pyrroline-5-carboxylate reductase
MKISIIGSGNIGGAIAQGLNSLGKKDLNIHCSDHSIELLNKLTTISPGINITSDNLEAVKDADIVIIAVKPWIVGNVIDEIKKHIDYSKVTVISIAAGIEFSYLSEALKNEEGIVPALFRIIPNTAIEIKESVNLIASYNAGREQIELIKNLFDDLGVAFLIDEKQMKAGTALSSCGIAYAFRYIRASTEGACELGLFPKQANDIVLQTLKGAVKLLETKNSHPEIEIDKVTTPGGLTIKGLNAMEEAGFTTAVIKGLKASM